MIVGPGEVMVYSEPPPSWAAMQVVVHNDRGAHFAQIQLEGPIR